MVQVGELMDAEPATPDAPPKPQWQVALGDAVRDRKLSPEAARLIRGALDRLDLPEERSARCRDGTSAGRGLAHRDAARRPRSPRPRSPSTTTGVAQREEALREKRCLHLYPQPPMAVCVSRALSTPRTPHT